MGGYVCINCGNAKEFTEFGSYSQSIYQELSADGYLEHESGDNDYNTDGAQCSHCGSENCKWVEDISELEDDFDSYEKYEALVEKIKERNEITELNLKRQKEIIDVNAKIQESEQNG